jgi:hypothetical protein
MHPTSRRDRHARRPRLEQCEDRIVQSIAVAPVGGAAAQPPETANTATGSQFVDLYKPALEHASRVFDDPFFFDVN